MISAIAEVTSVPTISGQRAELLARSDAATPPVVVTVEL